MSSEQIQITLPNGDVLQMERGSTAGDVAASIGPGRAKAAVAAVVGGETVSLSHPIDEDADQAEADSAELTTESAPCYIIQHLALVTAA